LRQTVLNHNTYHCYQPHTKFIQHSSVKINSTCSKKLLGIIIADFDETCQKLTIYSAFIKILETQLEYKADLYQLFIDITYAHYSVRREVLYLLLSLTSP